MIGTEEEVTSSAFWFTSECLTQSASFFPSCHFYLTNCLQLDNLSFKVLGSRPGPRNPRGADKHQHDIYTISPLNILHSIMCMTNTLLCEINYQHHSLVKIRSIYHSNVFPNINQGLWLVRRYLLSNSSTSLPSALSETYRLHSALTKIEKHLAAKYLSKFLVKNVWSAGM